MHIGERALPFAQRREYLKPWTRERREQMKQKYSLRFETIAILDEKKLKWGRDVCQVLSD
jgi:hypothetical protein